MPRKRMFEFKATYSVILSKNVMDKLRSMYTKSELASLVRRYLEFLSIEKRSSVND